MEGFAFEIKKEIKVVARKVKVLLAGIAVTIAVNAYSEPVSLNDMRMPDRIEQTVANATVSGTVSRLNLKELSERGERKRLLESSIESNGKISMDASAMKLWETVAEKSSEIPFRKVFVQYDDFGKSLFLSFGFAEDFRMDATFYVDEDDDNVYFSVYSKGIVFFQNNLPQDIFFKQAVSTYASV